MIYYLVLTMDEKVDKLGTDDGSDEHGSHVALQLPATPGILHICTLSASLILVHFSHILPSNPSSSFKPNIESEYIASSQLSHVSGQWVLTPL